MGLYYHGKPVLGQRGPAGPDGNPVGTILAFYGSEPPKDYLACDGSIQKIADYPDLADHFEKEFGLKHNYGGDGITTFGIPNMNGRFLLGAKDDDYQLGITGGEEKHTLTIDEMPNHYHNTYVRYGSAASISTGGSNYVLAGIGGTSNGTTYYTVKNGNDQPHNNMPPYRVVLFCIKAVAPSNGYLDEYSEDEICIGTWIDGRPIYRRVIKDVPVFTDNNIAITFFRFDPDVLIIPTNMYGFIRNPLLLKYDMIPNYDISFRVSIYWDYSTGEEVGSSTLVINKKSDVTGYKNFILHAVVEYIIANEKEREELVYNT